MIYLDNAATTKVDEKVVKEIEKAMVVNYGNPSSIHGLGREAFSLIERARQEIADEINCKASEIVFTSGGTESNNLALNILEKGDHLITTLIEHPSVLKKAKELENIEVSYLKVDNEGFIDLEHLRASFRKNTKLVSIIHGNNEIGTVQDIHKISSICRQKSVLLHMDCVQSLKKEKIEAKLVDMASFSAHKIHGPKGIGALYVKEGVKLKPILIGGSQESKKRAGTENVPGIVGFGKAVSLKYDAEKIRKLRDYLIAKIEKEIPEVKLNGPREKRLCNNVNFSFKHIEGESILMSLDMEGVCVSTGSACSSKNLDPSHVLMALGLSHETAHGSIRFSLSKYNTKEEIDFCVDKLKEIVERLRRISPR